jgi:hypothetical protein
MNEKVKFQAVFDHGFTVTIIVDYALFKRSKGAAHWYETKEEGQPRPDTYPKYMAWAHTVWTQVAKVINDQVVHTFFPDGLHGQRVYYLYKPDGQYEQVHVPRRSVG